MVMVGEYEDIIENVETLVEDDSKFPVVEDGRVKMFLKMCLECIKFLINYLLYNNASKKNSE